MFPYETHKQSKDLKGNLYPCVGLKSQGDSVEVNFGHKKFKYTGILFLIVFNIS